MNDSLLAEFRNAEWEFARSSPAKILRRNDIEPAAAIAVGGIGMQQTISFGGRLYEPSEDDGQKMLVLCVPPPWRCADGWELNVNAVDLCAFDPRAPRDWRLRLGDADGIGWWWRHQCWELDQPLLVVSDPLSWLRAAGEAFCILRPEAVKPALDGLGRVLVPDLETKKLIDDGVRMPAIPMPKIKLLEREYEHAA